MPWFTPTLKETRIQVRDEVTSALDGAVIIGNNVLRVMSDAMAGLCHLTLRFIDWLALQLLPDTAETEWLDRHGDIWLVNADGTTGRKMATLANGTVTLTGLAAAVVPLGTRLLGTNQAEYETTEEVAILIDAETVAPIRALDPGSAGNAEAGTSLALPAPPVDVDGRATVVTLTGGTDTEGDTELRIRVLERIRQPPMGGAAHDYVRWAKAVPGVTRAWCKPLEMGIGTVTVRVMMDELRADNDGFPREDDLIAATEYMDSVRPVAVKDFWVLAPIKQFINVQIRNLTPDTTATRGAIEDMLEQMLYRYASPGQTIYAAWKSYAIMSAPGVISFDLINTQDDIMESPGHMAVLGDIIYAI